MVARERPAISGPAGAATPQAMSVSVRQAKPKQRQRASHVAPQAKIRRNATIKIVVRQM
jgi:hypothetical protein